MKHRATPLPTITFMWNVAGKCWDVIGTVPEEKLRDRVHVVKVHTTAQLDAVSMKSALFALRAEMESWIF